jgi:hypothetical protein
MVWKEGENYSQGRIAKVAVGTREIVWRWRVIKDKFDDGLNFP